jgi:hypothetical protein
MYSLLFFFRVETKFFCTICNDGKNYHSYLSLQAHTSTHFQNALPVEESESSESESSDSFWTSDTSESDCFEEMNQYVCWICSSPFSSRPALEMHIAQHVDERKQLMCKICKNGHVYSSTSALKKHVETHYEPQNCFMNNFASCQKQVTCKICKNGYVYSSPSALKTHIKTCHETQGCSTIANCQKQLMCKICKNGHVYSSPSALKKHVETHYEPQPCSSNKWQEQLTCNICKTGYVYSSPSALKTHKKLHSQTVSFGKGQARSGGGHVTFTQRQGKNRFGDTMTLTKKMFLNNFSSEMFKKF